MKCKGVRGGGRFTHDGALWSGINKLLDLKYLSVVDCELKPFTGKEPSMRFDLHMHTSRYSSDSAIDPYDLIERASEVGLDGIVITEHDRLWPELELEELRARANGLVVLAGVEITGRGGDMLCYGVSDLSALPKGVPWRELTSEVHRQGGVCVAAHPYRWGQPFDDLLEAQQPELEGIEMMSNNMDADLRAKAATFKKRRPEFTGLGNSDAHEVAVVGCCYTDFEAEIRTMGDLIAAIRSGRAEPRVNGFTSQSPLRSHGSHNA
jgi:predicted metal-dependent phosphoesterase TrpH